MSKVKKIISPFVYKAKVNRVVDGDTVILDTDLGFNVYSKVTFRLARINAPEKVTEEGKVSSQYLADLLPTGKEVLVKSKDKDRYGRYIAEIETYIDDVDDLVNISDHLVSKEKAANKTY